MRKLILKTIRWIAALFIGSTVFAVIVFRFIPVYITPLMIIRCFQQAGNGHIPALHHSWTSLDNISPHLPVAVMASEDQRFLLHHGFDMGAIEKAAKRNLRGGKTKLGASTISQQTVKNVFLWPGRSWVRKGLEAYFTVLVELLWSKQRIMEVYLNSIEMGDGIYGASAVAKYNFGKSAADLTRGECALIAATLPNPRVYSSKSPSSYMLKRKSKIEHEMKFIPTFPREGEKINTKSVSGGIYKK